MHQFVRRTLASVDVSELSNLIFVVPTKNVPLPETTQAGASFGPQCQDGQGNFFDAYNLQNRPSATSSKHP
jgi:hypothetical protein